MHNRSCDENAKCW